MYESYRFVRWMRNKLGSVLDKRGHRRVDFGARNLALGKRRRAQHKVESNSHAKSHGSSGQNRHSGVHSERSMNMEAKPPLQQSTQDEQIRTALDQHWTASDANDYETEHSIYLEEAVLEYPQSGERTRGRSNIQNQRASQPNKKRFSIRRIIGSGELWVTEFILTYDGKPSYTVSIMEFKGDKVARETQYFAGPFVAPAFRAQWVERMDTQS